MKKSERKLLLNSIWQLHGRPEEPDARPCAEWTSATFSISAAVPGNIESALEDANIVPELFWGRNAEKLRPYEFFEWLFERDFEYDASLRHPRLVLEGIDCFGTVFLNGHRIGETSNAFIAHEFSVAKYLVKGRNHLGIHLASANNQLKKFPMLPGALSLTSFNLETLWLRKPAHVWGWDIAPRMALGGIWRNVYLAETAEHRFEDIFLDTVEVSAKQARLHLYLKVSTPLLAGQGKLFVKISGNCDDSRWENRFALWSYNGSFEITVQKPKLWMPRNYGEAHLYTVTVSLCTANGDVLTEETLTLGIRRIVLKAEASCTDSPEPDFQFLVNGCPVRIFGTNHVPADALHSHDAERYDMILDNAVALNCNMLRCWGGGIYEDDTFYDRCDREGILVWQDFMMGCAIYPDLPEFRTKIRTEVTTVIRKLRQHPSIALWAGDNECDLVGDWAGYRLDPNRNSITRELLPEICRMEDPLRPFLPSSPFISKEANRRGRSSEIDNMEFATEQHLWGPRDYFKSICPVSPMVRGISRWSFGKN